MLLMFRPSFNGVNNHSFFKLCANSPADYAAILWTKDIYKNWIPIFFVRQTKGLFMKENIAG